MPNDPTRLVAIRILAACLWMGAASGLAQADEPSVGPPTAEQREFFEQRVRPLLAEHCYKCHSAKAEKLQAGLRLDSRVALLKGGDSGPAVIPGDPEQSLLLSAVRYASFEMPPSGKLAEAEIAALEQWIRQGAWWPEQEAAASVAAPAFDWRSRQQQHWAWQPIRAPAPPAVTDSQWASSPIDQFIFDRLRDAQLEPSAAADAYRLVRRLYLDLIGLPPTPEQVEAFVAAPTAEAYRDLVEQLLQSSHFGEKWARHWMDLVRYAETCGHEFDYPIPEAYRYRDYLVRAFNADVPYDQLVREHIAGDLLPKPRLDPETGANESIVGTGFWFLGEAVHAPTDVRGDEADRVDNQINVFGKTFLGMTLGCARCHDHKFDPIPQTDYYALAGFLQSSRRQEALLDTQGRIEQQTARIADQRRTGDRMLVETLNESQPAVSRFGEYLLAAQAVLSRHDEASADARATELDPRLLERFVAALQDPALASSSHPLHTWQVLAASDTAESWVERRQRLASELRAQQQAYQAALDRLVSFADFHAGNYDDWHVTGWAFGTGPTGAASWDGPDTAARFAPAYAAHSGRLGRRQQGVLRSQTFTIQHGRIHYRMLGEDVQVRLIVDSYVMDIYNALLFADITLENVNTQGAYRWVTQRQDLDHYLGHRAHLEIIDHGDGYAAVQGIYMGDSDPPPEPPHALNRRLADDASIRSLEDLAAGYAGQLQAAAGPGVESAEAELLELHNWLLKWQLIAPAEGWQQLAEDVEQAQRALPAPLHVTAMADGTGEDERLHIRGNHRNLGDPVPRRWPVVIGGEDEPAIDKGSGRLRLAERLVARDNPLVSRVIVNRLWHHLMGRGIVPTVDDLGTMGQPPSHPKLLDWLARDLMDHGWSLKHTIRQIVLSRTYQQASEADDPRAERVDPGNQYWHRALVRRLTAEALRDSMLSISGRLDPTLFGPSVPVHLTDFMSGRGRPASGPLDGDGRRSIYIRVQRNFLSPLMLTFDMPSPFSTMGRRSVSNVPAQALILMNDEFVWQQAEVWARRALQATSDPERRIEQLFLAALARPPRAEECARLHEFIRQQAALREQPADSIEVWTDVCHALWNAKEFLYLF